MLIPLFKIGGEKRSDIMFLRMVLNILVLTMSTAKRLSIWSIIEAITIRPDGKFF